MTVNTGGVITYLVLLPVTVMARDIQGGGVNLVSGDDQKCVLFECRKLETVPSSTLIIIIIITIIYSYKTANIVLTAPRCVEKLLTIRNALLNLSV